VGTTFLIFAEMYNHMSSFLLPSATHLLVVHALIHILTRER
jgi:hypothetical protein